MPNNTEQNQNNDSSSPRSLWNNPVFLGPVVAALIGIPAAIIANDKLVPPPNPPVPKQPNTPLSPNTNEDFFVIAGSSEYKDELSTVPKKVKIKMGEGFDDRYKDIKICPSITESKKWYLVISSNLSSKDAGILTNQARYDGFRSDTYSQREPEIDFIPAQCEQIIVN